MAEEGGKGRGLPGRYGKPPRHTRFRKGRSRNPRGRPRDSKASATLIRQALLARVEVRENGRVTNMSKLAGDDRTSGEQSRLWRLSRDRVSLHQDPLAANRTRSNVSHGHSSPRKLLRRRERSSAAYIDAINALIAKPSGFTKLVRRRGTSNADSIWS